MSTNDISMVFSGNLIWDWLDWKLFTFPISNSFKKSKFSRKFANFNWALIAQVLIKFFLHRVLFLNIFSCADLCQTLSVQQSKPVVTTLDPEVLNFFKTVHFHWEQFQFNRFWKKNKALKINFNIQKLLPFKYSSKSLSTLFFFLWGSTNSDEISSDRIFLKTLTSFPRVFFFKTASKYFSGTSVSNVATISLAKCLKSVEVILNKQLEVMWGCEW